MEDGGLFLDHFLKIIKLTWGIFRKFSNLTPAYI